MRHRVRSAPPGLAVPVAAFGAILILLVLAPMLSLEALALAALAALAAGVRWAALPLFSPRARYERRHMRLAGPRPGAWLG